MMQYNTKTVLCACDLGESQCKRTSVFSVASVCSRVRGRRWVGSAGSAWPPSAGWWMGQSSR